MFCIPRGGLKVAGAVMRSAIAYEPGVTAGFAFTKMAGFAGFAGLAGTVALAAVRAASKAALASLIVAATSADSLDFCLNYDAN